MNSKSKKGRENILDNLKVSNEEYTKIAKEVNKKERNDSKQEKRNIAWMEESEQFSIKSNE